MGTGKPITGRGRGATETAPSSARSLRPFRPAGLRRGHPAGQARVMSSRFWISLLLAVLIAALTFLVSRRLFGVTFLLLPLFFLRSGRGPKDK
jgi:hypothetical protein